ncbi:hypothetical protein EDD17DRAFT_894810 [Pisolithus thermaeus]|nr:hypothetical protein EDD17DRAFT_894810 [Pisolithus thermaeus]
MYLKLSLPHDMFDYYLQVFSSFCNNQFALCRKLRDVGGVEDDDSSIKSSSGPARTHAVLADSKPVKVGPRVIHTEHFICKGGVDSGRLLDLSRKKLYMTAKAMGGNVLLDEQWDCRIRHPKLQKHEFKVTIHYSATVARSFSPDGQRPVGIEAAKGIKGLMTVLDRHAELWC